MRRARVAGTALVLACAGCGWGAGGAPGQPPQQPPSGSVARPEPPPTGPAAVWWDADGLHRGDLVQPAAVPLTIVNDTGILGGERARTLALVRSGVLYRDHRSGEVWYDPWVGEPRVVGTSTAAGPGGDPEGDVAAWFDGRELVVYDTARDVVISRTPEPVQVSSSTEYVEHVGHGNGWVHVSPTQVVWRYGGDMSYEVARRDLVAEVSETPWEPRAASDDAPLFVDVSSRTAVWVRGPAHSGRGTYVFDSAESDRTEAVGLELEYPGRLSPDGTWLLTAEIADGTHGVAITDLRTGETWKPFDERTYAFFSWAYGDVAVMRTDVGEPGGPWSLTSCRASTRTCVELETRGDVVLLPNP